MTTHAETHHRSILIGWASLLLALVIYSTGLGSDHLATNGDELLYAQISKLTVQSGHLLPLQTLDDRLRNTKPPLLFWQGILSTSWGEHWTLTRLRAPNVLYTLLTAGLLLIVGWKRGRDPALGLMAALLFLCFFSTYRYGRVFLTSAPETFWLFLPIALLVMRRKPSLPNGVLWPWLWGGIIGVGLLYKSFALVVPVAVTLALWQWRARRWNLREFFIRDLWRLSAMGATALLVFSLWFWLDPHPGLVFRDFVLRENVTMKFDTGGGNYFLNLIWGGSSLWRIVASYPIDAGLLALPVMGLAWDAWVRRRRLGHQEVLLWIWVLVLAAFFCIPNQRDERYLLPAMPALAMLLALRLGHLPRWLVGVTLAAAGIVMAGLTGLALLLEHAAAIGPIYPPWAVMIPGIGLVIVLAGLMIVRLSRSLMTTAILFVYLCYAIFLLPLDHGPGRFHGEGAESVIGCEVSVPSNFNAREESYGFLLPGATVKPYDHAAKPPASQFVVISLPLDQPAPEGVILGKRLNMIDRFNAEETRDILTGNITRHLFHWDWLVQQH